MGERIDLYYSEKCKHSAFFIQQLQQQESLYQKVNLISVHNVQKLPPSVKSVPHMIITNSHGTQNLIDEDLTIWLVTQITGKPPEARRQTMDMNQEIAQRQQIETKRDQPPAFGSVGRQGPSELYNNQDRGAGTYMDYDPIGMSGAFSDPFSSLENPDSTLDHRFESVNEPYMNMEHPGGYSLPSDNSRDKKTADFDNRLKEVQDSRR